MRDRKDLITVLFIGDMLVSAFMIGVIVWVSLRSTRAQLDAAARNLAAEVHATLDLRAGARRDGSHRSTN